MKQDVYQQVTDRIIADLEQGELTWLKPWSAGNMDGRIMKPLRHWCLRVAQRPRQLSLYSASTCAQSTSRPRSFEQVPWWTIAPSIG
jgi:antirestriction protein ArdC